MYSSMFTVRPAFHRFPGYPIAVGKVAGEPEHEVRGNRYPPHTYNLHYIRSGSGWIKTESGIVHLSEGQGFLCSDHHVQYYGSNAEDPWEVWWIFCDGEGIRRMLGDKALGDPWVFAYPDIRRVDESVLGMWELGEARDASLAPKLAAQLIEILLELLLHSTDLHAPSRRSIEDRIRSTAEYMKGNSVMKLTLQQAADHAGVSMYYFNRLFKRYMGITPMDYMNEHRIATAKQMLLATPHSIKRIGLEVGYSRSSYFIERFRLVEGVTPAQYRERYSAAEDTKQ
ncbi:AraC family transcriptional regulator [Paenibacillus sp. GCM10023252]|uniref:helix-turn-helix transcriptional regulator n=1 Tax=Paenibacillus sp. GCM10023252 TaxID=3252649 RepID=UPI003609C6AD